MKECECKDWASNDILYVNMFGHHPGCLTSPSNVGVFLSMLEIVKSLTTGMESWSHDEDGIHPDAWKAYKRAKMILGEEF